MKFDILTIFPEVIRAYVNESILKRAQEDAHINIKAHDLRQWSNDKHNKVDDTPYGGGPGMVMKVEPFHLAINEIKKDRRAKVIMTAASGKRFTQQDAQRLSQECDQIIFLCGRYEGIDHRVNEHLADEVFSIGDYVLTGGELPAMVMTDAIARLVPGVIEEDSLKRESHSTQGYKEHPQYTKPEEYNGWKVPKILLSGDHAKIEEWRQAHSKKQQD